MTCPACLTGNLTLCTGPVLSAPMWADPLSTDGKLRRKQTIEPFIACDACEWAKRAADVMKGRV